MRQAGHRVQADIARKQLDLLLGVAEQARIDDIRLQHELHLTPSEWRQWLDVLHDAPLPPHPEVPELLRRLGYVASRLDRVARHARG